MSENKEPVDVPLHIYLVLECKRRQGLRNMLDYEGILSDFADNEEDAAVIWMEENADKWGRLVFRGPRVIAPNGNPIPRAVADAILEAAQP